MTNGPPEIVHLAVELHLRPVEMPFPLSVLAHAIDAFSVELSRNERAETLPQITQGLAADLDTTHEGEILDPAQRQLEADAQHRRNMDDPRAGT